MILDINYKLTIHDYQQNIFTLHDIFHYSNYRFKINESWLSLSFSMAVAKFIFSFYLFQEKSLIEKLDKNTFVWFFVCRFLLVMNVWKPYKRWIHAQLVKDFLNWDHAAIIVSMWWKDVLPFILRPKTCGISLLVSEKNV